MRSTEDLLNMVRDADSRAQLTEAVRAYQAGAFRAAIISTWVTVALDVVAKLRELAESDDPPADQWIARLDDAIASNNVQQLQRIESSLLDTAETTFQLITAREAEELRRLHADRHICAHPAFVEADRVFEPTPELVRAHMRTAVDALLRHGPRPGRRAADRFFAESKSVGWPADVGSLGRYLEAQFLSRGTESLRRSLAIVMVKGALAPPDDDLDVSERLADAAHALDGLRPSLLEEACERVVRRWEEVRGLTDDELRRLVGALGDLPQPWAALPPASLGRVVAVISSSSHEELLGAGAYGRDVPVREIKAAVDARIAGLGLAEFHQVVSRRARPAMLNRAMELLEEAGSFRTAETAFACLVPLAPFLDSERLQRLIEVFKKPNGQVRWASDVPPFTEMVFDSAPADAEMALLWADLATWLRDQADDPDEYYAYPGLYERVHR